MKFNPLVNIKGSKSLSVSPVHENGNSIATSSWDDNKNRDIQRKFIKPCIATVLMFSCLLSTSHAQVNLILNQLMFVLSSQRLI